MTYNGEVMRGTSRQPCCHSTASASGEYARGGRLGWTTAGTEAWAARGLATHSESRAQPLRERLGQGSLLSLLPGLAACPAACQLPRALSYLPTVPAAPIPATRPYSTSSVPASPTQCHLSLVLQAMGVLFFFTQLLLSHNLPMVGYDLDEDTRKRMQEHEEQLSQMMAWLTEEMEQREQEHSMVVWEALLSTALQQWKFQAFLGVVVLLFCLCALLWKNSCDLRNSSSTISLEGDSEEDEDDFIMDRFREKRMLSQRLDLDPSWQVVEELVDDLIFVCQFFSKNSFVPQLWPPVRLGVFQDSQTSRGEDLVYRLLVPLGPPCGHSFHLMLGPEREVPVRNVSVRVELECTCTGQQRTRNMLCFLHHPEDQLRSRQEASLLQTFCIGPYLNVQKTAFWLQVLLKISFMLLPCSTQYDLTVLPSTRYCRLKLIDDFESSFCIELILAVQEGSSGPLVAME
ncbi:LOW QUALITY PROTEIN: inositol 1,4,5-trisphosphate receptor-interacting protein-like 1 [Cuculus canorus]|uniref:LOW QUALITY PROTEIN: inositol 1,4,5-trisphosphate receptor-interacting protein-like 1 n=1 Tax=Cuculus canorus TaxID=55661 RepID=UPI0023AAA9AE|nr:LOW QUALITY PROTEIN: inositol 1,4,5-trisphosphate receptor-interacting protein-like 1 [Cuculus canorus]